MTFPLNPEVITWRLHLHSSPAAVYALLATDAGRARFWAEDAVERDSAIDFMLARDGELASGLKCERSTRG